MDIHDLKPVNQEAEELLKETLLEENYHSIDIFIKHYNRNLLNTNNKDVADIADLIVQTYENIKLIKAGSNSKLVITRKEEIAIANIQEFISYWGPLASLKRIALELLSDGYEETTKLIFKTSKPGLLHIEKIENEKLVLDQHPIKDKIFSSNTSLATNPLFSNKIYKYEESEEDENIIYLLLGDIIDVDDSFVLEVEKDLLDRIRK